jgi:hypothetical protein
VRFPHARPRGDSMRFHQFGFRNTCYQDVDASRVVARMATERCCIARKRPAKSRLSGSFACDSVNQHQEWPSGSQIERVPFSRLRAA